MCWTSGTPIGPDGLFRFQTIVPAAYPFGGSARRPAHIHYKISAPGYEPLTTQMYFAGDPYLDKDPIRNVRDSLIVDLEEHKDGKKMGAPQVKQRCFRGVFDVALIPESKA